VSEIVMHPLLGAVFSKLNEINVTWCALRPHRLAQISSNGDVDLLVAPGDKGAAVTVLTELGFVRIPTWGRASHSFYLTYDAPTDAWVKIDMVSELAFGPLLQVKLDVETVCLQHRHQCGDLFVLAPDDAFWTLLLHCLLDKGSISEAHARQLSMLASYAQRESTLGQAVAEVCPPGWCPERLIDKAHKQDNDALLAVARELLARWVARQGIHARLRAQGNRVLRFFARMVLRPRHGLIASLITQTGDERGGLTSELNVSWPFPVSHYRAVGSGEDLGGRRTTHGPFAIRILARVSRERVRQLTDVAQGKLVILYGPTPYVTERPLLAELLRRTSQRLSGSTRVPPHVVIRILTIETMDRPVTREEGEEALTKQNVLRTLGAPPSKVLRIDPRRGPDYARREVTSFLWTTLARRFSHDH
jgi:hypothetical protein